MASLFTMKLLTYLHFPSSPLRLTLLFQLARLSTGTLQTKDLPFMAEYLISSFGFCPDRALRIATSAPLSSVKTSDRPEAVVRFFKETGLTDSQIKSIISWVPQLLGYSTSKIFEQRVQELMAAGFTGDTLIRLIRCSPAVLCSKSALSRLQFWRNYIGSDRSLTKIIARNPRLIQFDIDKTVMPVMKLLKDYGFSDADVRRMWSLVGFSLRNLDSTKKLLEETEALGFVRKSRMFILALPVVGRYSGDIIMRKFLFLRNSYNWSEEDVQTAFKRFPNLVTLSENKLKSKMDFLIGSAGLTDQNIISSPALLGYSLEKRIVPRHHVLNVLKIKGLNKSASIYGAVKLSEKGFLEKFVRPYKKEIPELEEAYAAACQGNI